MYVPRRPAHRIGIAAAVLVISIVLGLYLHTRSVAMSRTVSTLVDHGTSTTPGWELVMRYDGSGQLTYLTGIKIPGVSFAPGTFSPMALRRDMALDTLKSSYRCDHTWKYGGDEDYTFGGHTYQGIDCYLNGGVSPIAVNLDIIIAIVKFPNLYAN